MGSPGAQGSCVVTAALSHLATRAFRMGQEPQTCSATQEVDMMSCLPADLRLWNVMGNERSGPFPRGPQWGRITPFAPSHLLAKHNFSHHRSVG